VSWVALSPVMLAARAEISVDASVAAVVDGEVTDCTRRDQGESGGVGAGHFIDGTSVD
jgi:hypothetical protein